MFIELVSDVSKLMKIINMSIENRKQKFKQRYNKLSQNHGREAHGSKKLLKPENILLVNKLK